jgi:hypothetical protein
MPDPRRPDNPGNKDDEERFRDIDDDVTGGTVDEDEDDELDEDGDPDEDDYDDDE